MSALHKLCFGGVTLKSGAPVVIFVFLSFLFYFHLLAHLVDAPSWTIRGSVRVPCSTLPSEPVWLSPFLQRSKSVTTQWPSCSQTPLINEGTITY